MVGGEPIASQEVLSTSEAELPEARDVELPAPGELPNCDEDCRSYCDGLELRNPVHRGLCPSLWGAGLEPRPIAGAEACRRLFADTIGRFPTRAEVADTCRGRPWGEVVAELIGSEEFVDQNGSHWADRLLYDTEAVSVVRIYDVDELVAKLYRGAIPYDQFAAVVSAHPVLTRRYATPGDRAEALFELFLGRPPLGAERSDIAKLYTLWENGYYDHPQLGMRLPDAFIRYRCIDEETGEVDEETRGQCTSILFGYHELILEPDIRAHDGEMWSGLVEASEWEELQIPGRLLSRETLFWEKAVDDVLEQYLDYDLGRRVPEVRQELVRHLLDNGGDIRVVHQAVLSSVAYLQTTTGSTERDFRWTYGPLKQATPEIWIDTITRGGQYEMGDCDHRIGRPGRILGADTVAAHALVANSNWEIDEDGEVRGDYRDLARGLGGCPDNSQGGRFEIISILNTSTQLNFVDQVCNPSLDDGRRDAPVEVLLPEDVPADRAVDAQLARSIVEHQIDAFYGRAATPEELDEAADFGERCARTRCRAEEFARPACFALLSSSEMLFY